MAALDRFKHAQEQSYAGFDTALEEMRAGHKRSHWIWYIFPQLSSLGSSEASRMFGIHGLAHAMAYLGDPLLRRRFLTITQVVAEKVEHDRVPLRTLMGSEIDAKKLVSSLTLFEPAARALDATEPQAELRSIADTCGRVLRAAAAEGYPRCPLTLEHIASAEGG